MTIRAGFFEETTSAAVTAVAAAFTAAGVAATGNKLGARMAYLVQSDKTVHLSRSGDAAVSTGLRIPANTVVLLNCFAAESISFILGTGETDGTIWFTKVDH